MDLTGTVDLGETVTLTVYGKFLQRYPLFWTFAGTRSQTVRSG